MLGRRLNEIDIFAIATAMLGYTRERESSPRIIRRHGRRFDNEVHLHLYEWLESSLAERTSDDHVLDEHDFYDLATEVLQFTSEDVRKVPLFDSASDAAGSGEV